MKPSQPTKRPRGHRGNGRRPNGGRNSNFESSGPQGKIRGTAYQVIEKYQALGRDALTFGDRVAAENYFQHADHFTRILNEQESFKKARFSAESVEDKNANEEKDVDVKVNKEDPEKKIVSKKEEVEVKVSAAK